MMDGLRIFVVEDETLIALMLEDMLGQLGHRVVDVASGVDSALRALRAAPTLPDAAVVDANLAGHSALPVVEALRERGVPVVIASAYEPDELARLGFRERVLRKPYRIDDLATALAV